MAGLSKTFCHLLSAYIFRFFLISHIGCVFLAFRKGAAICCGLDFDLSGFTTKKNGIDPEQMSLYPQFEWPIA